MGAQKKITLREMAADFDATQPTPEEVESVKKLVSEEFNKINDFTLPTQADFEMVKELCLNEAGFQKLSCGKSDENPWKLSTIDLKTKEGGTKVMFKLEATCRNLKPKTVYDMLHDPEYRKEWDSNMLEGFNLCRCAPYADIGVYFLKIGFTFANRFSINQRTWHKFAGLDEYIIMNHSVDDPDCTEEEFKKNNSKINRKKHVQMHSYVTCFYLSPDPKDPTTLRFIYITCSDLHMSISNWITTQITKYLIPGYVTKIFQLSLKYDEWKENKASDKTKPWEISDEKLWAYPNRDSEGYKEALEKIISEQYKNSKKE